MARPQIKQLLDLLGALFNLRTAFFYGVSPEGHLQEIAGQTGAFRPYCQLIQTELKAKCAACDRVQLAAAARGHAPWLYRCYNGLYEMVLPLRVDQRIAGYLHFGQVRSGESFAQIRQECKLEQHSQVAALQEQYEQMDIVPQQKLQLLAQLFTQLAGQVLQNQWVSLRKASPLHVVRQYIEENLSGPVTVAGAAASCGRSPSYVTHQFRQQHGRSFQQYVLARRVEQACRLLGRHTVAEAAVQSGFKSRYHFSRVFKQLTGAAPTQYQKQLRLAQSRG